MKIIYCSWNENSKNDLYSGLKKITEDVTMIVHSVKEYLSGSVDDVLNEIIQPDVDIVISFDFIPNISSVCNKKKVKYISWVYDWPNFTLYDENIYNECNRVFIFDREGIERLSRYNVGNLFYSTLAVNCDRVSGVLLGQKSGYLYDVSMVGNLYLGLQDAMMTPNVPEYYEGFVNALANSQQKIYGYNLADNVIDRAFAEKYFYDIHTEINGTNVPKEYILSSQINKYITGIERRNILKELSRKYDVHLFAQKAPDEMGNVIIHGGVDYENQMPVVFSKTKINLNISLRSITSGIPLRVFDILGAGGMCVTNYQQQIMEHFVDGQDLVVFSSVEELEEKVEYYLEHEKEREEIARNGKNAVSKYSYENVLREMFNRI